jgi:hypothetical protein
VHDKARHIRERFPDKNRSINLLITKDPEFLALCEDHDACVDALQYWAKSKAPETKTRVNEYRALVRELQEEIIQTLVTKKPRQLD